MLSETGQWFKTTEIETDDAKLALRRQAAGEILTAWEKAAPSTIVKAVSLGLEALKPIEETDNRVLPAIMDAITNAQPSVERDHVERSLEPRLLALMTIGEMLGRRLGRDDNWRRNEPAVIAAECLASALRYAAKTGNGFLVGRIQGLLASADALLSKMDGSRRNRTPKMSEKVAAIRAGGDLPSAKAAIADALEQMLHDQNLDREELQALWWVFGGYSLLGDDAFAALPDATAALFAGAELASIVHWPGTSAMSALAQRIIRKPKERAGDGLIAALAAIDAASWGKAVPASAKDMLVATPALFPVTSVAFVDADDRLNSLSALKSTLSPADLAAQVFMERSLQRSVDG